MKKATLFVIPGSHPSMTARLMLERKRVPYRRIDLGPALHKPILRALRFPGNTVPALFLDGRRVQGSTRIARELDAIRPEPRLFPEDPERRRAVEEAERFGDEELQPVPRRLVWWAMRREPSAGRSFLEGSRMGLPLPVAERMTPAIARIAIRINRATDEAIRADLAALPGLLDRVDELVREGVIGGGAPNAADFQIATGLRLLLCLDDVRPAIAGRLAEGLARKVVPDYPGRMPPVFPKAWLEPLRAAPAVPASG